MAEYYEGEKEAWNMATSTLKRLSWLLDMSSVAAQQQNFKDWFYVLMDLRRNLAPFMTPEEYEKIWNKFKELPPNWIIGEKVNPMYTIQVHRLFDEIAMELLKVMNKKGLLMPEKKDTGKAIVDF